MKNNTQEIIDNNILLAKFMGLEFNTDFGMFYVPIEKEEYNADSLKFHNNWNWLMQVVDKINSLEDAMVSINKLGTFLKIKEETQFFNIINFSFENLSAKNTLQATYNVCVSFVKWYNQNKGGN